MGEIKAATNPEIVIGATASDASKFAGSEKKENWPESATMMGRVKRVADNGIERASGNLR